MRQAFRKFITCEALGVGYIRCHDEFSPINSSYDVHCELVEGAGYIGSHVGFAHQELLGKVLI